MSCCDDDGCGPSTPLCLPRGSSKSYLVRVRRVTGAAYDLTGALAYFTIRRSADDSSAVAFKRNLAAGGSSTEIEMLPQTGDTIGHMIVHLLHADTKTLDPRRSYVYDCWIVTAIGEYHQVLHQGVLTVGGSVSTVAVSP